MAPFFDGMVLLKQCAVVRAETACLVSCSNQQKRPLVLVLALVTPLPHHRRPRLFCSMCSPPDVPSAPSGIALLLCTGSEMVLSWRAPARTGGAPVRGYYLDQREEGAELWREVNVKAVRERRLKVSPPPTLWQRLVSLSRNVSSPVLDLTHPSAR